MSDKNLFDEFDKLFEDNDMNAVLVEAQKEVGEMEAAACIAENPGQQNLLAGMGIKEKPQSCSAPSKTTTSKAASSKKAKSNSCSAPAVKPKEPENDLERYVVLTNFNEQKSYPAEMTLEQIREELEKEFPALTKDNTSWYFEKQQDKNRYLCIPNYKSNKAG